jgi:PKD repeat protein
MSSRFVKLARVSLSFVAVAIVLGLFQPIVFAEERKFLVFLANMRRSFVGQGEDADGGPVPSGHPRIPLPSLETLEDNYFRIDPDNGLGSMAEYWEEVSYGIVRIDGKALGIVELPWPQYPVIGDVETTAETLDEVSATFSPDEESHADDGTGGYFDLDGEPGGLYVGEAVAEDSRLYPFDPDNSGPAPPTLFIPGLNDGLPSINTEDVDSDGHLDLGLEDIDGDNRFDLIHEDINNNCVLDMLFSFDDWFCGNQDGNYTPDEDCDGDGIPVFLNEDLDEDGHLDLGEDPNGCLSNQVTCASDADCVEGLICNPEPINPDEIQTCCNDIDGDGLCADNEDLDGDFNFDITNEDTDGDCVAGAAGFPGCDGFGGPCCIETIEYIPPVPYDPIFTPGERFRDVDTDNAYDPIFEPATIVDVDNDGETNNFSDTNFALTDPEDYFDATGNQGQIRDFPEPLEDYMVMKITTDPGVGQYAPVSPQYIENNYPGNVPDLINRIGNNRYDSPDAWAETLVTNPDETESGTNARKLEIITTGAAMTPEPSWYRDAWRARYGNLSAPPLWVAGSTPVLEEFDPISEDDSTVSSVEYAFTPNKGGTGGWGSVLEQMLHIIDALILFGLQPDPLMENIDDTTSTLFDYDGTEYAYAYGEAILDEPIEDGLTNDFIFGLADDGFSGCIMQDGAEQDGSWGCDFDMDGDFGEVAVFGPAPTYLITVFPGADGGPQDFDGDGQLDDLLFDPCDLPGHPDCGPGGAQYTFPLSQGPPDEQEQPDANCPCIAFNIQLTDGFPEADGTCCDGGAASGTVVGDNEDEEIVCGEDIPTIDCLVPRCRNEEGGSPFYPFPRFNPPAEPECQIEFARRFGDGTMIPVDDDFQWPGFETGEADDPVLPPANLVYDGPKEYDDLASSMYHTQWRPSNPADPREAGIPAILMDYGGDQALGEVTTTDPASGNRNNFGHDQGGFEGPTSISGDGNTVAAGPLAGGNTAYDVDEDGFFNGPMDHQLDEAGQPEPIHGGPGFDGGNLLALEFLTRRTDGTSLTEPLSGPATPDGRGFRDFNLDNMLDLGEGRALGTDNYALDSDPATTPDGMDQEAYPFNRHRLTEDAVEFMDFSEDFDHWVNGPVGCIQTTNRVDHIILLPEGLPSATPFAVFSPDPDNAGINTLDDIDDPAGQEVRNQVVLEDMLQTTIFTNLGASLDRSGETEDDQDEGGIGLVAFAAHEFGHFWECWPDLYDYDVFAGGILERPIGRYDLMAGSGSGLVHVIPNFKESSGWIDPIDLRTVLTPGVAQTINLSPIEFVSDSYFFYENHPTEAEDRLERFWFYHLHDHGEFSSNLPWNVPSLEFCESGGGSFKEGGMAILHTDVNANSEAHTPQQRIGSHFTYQYEQADGQHSMETQFGNSGDSGDPFPGFCDITEWNELTEPDNTWHYSGESQTLSSGIEILGVQLELTGTATTFLWFPREIPTLRFLQPPGGQSIGTNFPLIFRWSDLNAGSGVTIFAERTNPLGNDQGHPADAIVVDELGICSVDCYDGEVQNDSLNNPIPKDTPGNSSEEIQIGVGQGGLDDSFYRFYAFLDPAAYSPGVDGINEMGFTPPIFSDVSRRDDVAMNVTNVVLDPSNSNSSRLEGWTVTYVGNEQWEVCGSISGLQTLDGSYVRCEQADTFGGQKAFALTNQPFVTTNPPGAMAFTINNTGGDLVTVPPDRFAVATTGFTAYSEMIEVRDGQVDPGPKAVIAVTSDQEPCCFPGVAIAYNGSASTDADGNTNGIAEYRWDIGDDNPVGSAPDAIGPMITVNYDDPGEYRVRLTVIEQDTNRIASTVHTVTVANQKPVAEFTASPDSGPVPLLVEFDATSSFDPDGDDPLMFEWDFNFDGAFVADLGPTVDATPIRSFDEGSYVVALRVTDATGNQSMLATVAISAGNTPPVAGFTATPGAGTAPLTVVFNASDSLDAEDDALTYHWSFGDGSDEVTTSNPIILHEYTDTGLFQVRLEVSDGSPVLGSAQTVINVSLGNGNIITADMNATPVVGASPLAVTFTANASDTLDESLSYRWEFGDGRLGFGRVISHTYLNNQEADLEYNAVLIVSDSGGTQGTANRMITVQPTDGTGEGPSTDPDLTLQFAVADDSAEQGSAPLDVTFDTRGSMASGGLVFDRIEIDFGDGAVETQLVPGPIGHQYSTPGQYNASAALHAVSGEVTESAPIVITVFASAPPIASFSADPLTGDAPLLVNFDATGSFDPENDTLEYEWVFGDGSVGAGALATHTYNAVGTYTATLTVRDSTGAFDSTSRSIAVTQGDGGTPGGLPDPDEPAQDDPAPVDCGSCGAMGGAQLLLMLVGIFGLRMRRRLMS